jgi:hypothetical protein
MCTYVSMVKVAIIFAFLVTFQASCSSTGTGSKGTTSTEVPDPEHEREILMLVSLAREQTRDHSFDMESYEFKLTRKNEYRILEFHPKRVGTKLPDGRFVVGADGGGTLLFRKLNGNYEFVGHFISQ